VILPNGDRLALWERLMRLWSDRREGLTGLTKADLRAAVDAADAWVDANATSYNTALPQPARGALTTGQKALILAHVCLRRAGEV
jgi:hypothetical protein